MLIKKIGHCRITTQEQYERKYKKLGYAIVEEPKVEAAKPQPRPKPRTKE